MKVLIFLACAVFVAHAATLFDPLSEEWNLFKIQYNKNYSSKKEEKFRMKIFKEKKEKIEKHNAKYERGEVTFKMGINRFADMLPHEVNQMMKGYGTPGLKQGAGNSNRDEGSIFIPPTNVKIPDEVNWVKKGAVTPVKNQEDCGSCWAFSATGALEGQHFLKSGSLVSLSEQNLVDCSRSEGNYGCFGGLMTNAFNYVKINKGIDTESSYPYEGKDDKCRFNKSTVGATDTGYVYIPTGDEEALAQAVATVGPISLAIDASQESFELYADGVYYEPQCNSKYLDHGVLAVGYGTDSKTGEKYWLVKNSWGVCWGKYGYIKMARDRGNNCGIATNASYPLV